MGRHSRPERRIGDGHAQLRKKIPRPRRHADRRRPVRLLGRAVLRRLLRRHHALLRAARHRADRLGRGDRADLEPLADQHRAAGPEVRPRARAAARRRPVAAHHDLRDRRLRLLGAARGGDLPQARHRLARAVRLRLRDPRLRHAGGDPAGAAGRLGPRLPLRHLQPPRLGVERRLPVPALPLQPGAHDRRSRSSSPRRSRCRCTAR